MKVNQKLIKISIILVVLSILCYKNLIIPITKTPNKINNIYVINLKKSKQRRDNMIYNLNKLNLKYTIFNAINGADLKISDSMGNEFYGRDMKNVIKFGETYKIQCPNLQITYEYKIVDTDNPMLAGTLGCYCSHLEVLKQIHDKKETLSIILEDDIHFDKYFLSGIKSIQNTAIDTKKFSIIYLGMIKGKPGLGRKLKTFKYIPFSNLRKLSSVIPGLHAYATSHYGAASILKNTIKTDCQIDDKIHNAIIIGDIKNAYISAKCNINQENGPSDARLSDIHNTNL